MALTDDNNIVMPVQPMNYGGNGGFGFGGDWGSLIVLFLIAAMFGGFGGGWGGFGGGNEGTFPWLLASNRNTDALVQGGFNQAATAGTLAGIQNSITTGFSNAEVANCNRAIDSLQAAYSNQIASMNQSFANAQALDSRLDAIAMAQQNCCCENRAAVADLKYTVATEACADRAAIDSALRDVLAAQTAGIQSIKDQLCQDKIDAKNEQIANLQAQLNMANLAASQTAQTARLLADNAAQTQQIENYIRPQINPAYVVPNPYACYQNTTGCGCGYGVA